MKPAEVQVGPEIVVEMRGGIADYLPDYVREKVAAALVHSAAATPRAAIDMLVERLRHRLGRLPRDRRSRRGHEDGHTPVAGEPEIVRHATNSPVQLSADETVVEKDDLGLNFHLFVETLTGQDALVYRDGRADGDYGLIDPAARFGVLA